ncbi:MAG: hypothetical protein WBL31_18550 [Ilumatobacteraceae bacterium]
MRTSGSAGPDGSLDQLFGSNIAWDPADEVGAELQRVVLNCFQSSIAGGTDEIQRNIIGDRVLGLPREPSVDRCVSFRELKVGTRTD